MPSPFLAPFSRRHGPLSRNSFWLLAAFTACGFLQLRAFSAGVTSAGHVSKGAQVDFVIQVKPVLAEYCYPCHGEKKKGGLDFRAYTNQLAVVNDRPVFEKMLTKLQAHEMPPENKPQPSDLQRALLTNWINATFFYCDCNHPDPGRITIRRLNRVEYNNTIRDLLGVNFQPAADFPADDSGYGFDNIGDVLSLSPSLMEKYLAAAEKIVASAFSPNILDAHAAATSSQTNSVLHRLITRAQTKPPTPEFACSIITNFATRAFRRPLTPDEQKRLLQLWSSARANKESSEDCLKLALEAVLVSPHFLFRGEPAPDSHDSHPVHPVDDYILASRLSYFLWSSMPDDELFAQAAHQTLRKNLAAQTKRMLQDPKAHALIDNFAGQWLQLRNLKLVTPDPKLFPAFNEQLRASMQKETELCFETIWRENRSVLEFIDSDYTFLNESLANIYGILGIEGEEFRRVSLRDTPRGGLLTQASILTITSNPTRTSPVKRGKWVLENILGTPPPPPPANVPDLKEGKAALTGSLRQRMEQHRSDPNCAPCHARMDPIGFGFENFDAIGSWRERDGDFAIDASGKLISGETFNGPNELRALVLTTKRDDFVRCLTRKMLTYALGRGLEYYDRCAVEQIMNTLAKDHYRFDTLILEVVKSTPFQMRRSETTPPNALAQSP